MTDWSTQDAFESGILIGLRAAEAILAEGGNRASVVAYVAQMEDVKRRRDLQKKGVRPATESDIFLTVPLVHPADLGLAANHAADTAVAASRVRWNPTASGIVAATAGETRQGLDERSEQSPVAKPDAQP